MAIKIQISSPMIQPSGWKGAIPVTKQFDILSSRRVSYRLPEARKEKFYSKPLSLSQISAASLEASHPKSSKTHNTGSLSGRVESWTKPFNTYEKPIRLAQKAVKIAQKIPTLESAADEVSKTFQPVDGVYKFLDCLDALTSIEKSTESTKLIKSVMSLVKGLVSFVKWMDQVGFVNFEKITKKNLKALNLWNDFCSSLLGFSEAVQGRASHQKILQAGLKMLNGVLNLVNSLIEIQLIGALLKPLKLISNFFKAGTDLNDHYTQYREGKDTWKIALLRVGDTLSSIGLAILALAIVSNPTGTVATPSLCLSIFQLGAQILLYFHSS